MIKVPRSQSTSIKGMIYPEVKKTNNSFHKNNLNAIKKQQEGNKIKKDEKENYVPAEPYKLKEFKGVQSKFLNNNTTTSKANNENISNNYLTETKNKMKTAPVIYNKMGEKSKSVSLLKTKNKNSDKIDKKKELNNLIKIYNNIEGEEENIFSLGKSDNDIMEEYSQLKRLMNNSTKEKAKENPENNILKKTLKGPTPKATDINLLPQKIHKDHILENRIKITQNDVPTKIIKKEDAESAIHRNFGKTPDYLVKYKQDAENKKDEEKRKLEELKYPKGTRLLSDDERLETLSSLLESRKEIMTVLEKMPISMRTMSIQTRKTELENKLSEIETAVKTFSRKQVFIKIDS